LSRTPWGSQCGSSSVLPGRNQVPRRSSSRIPQTAGHNLTRWCCGRGHSSEAARRQPTCRTRGPGCATASPAAGERGFLAHGPGIRLCRRPSSCRGDRGSDRFVHFPDRFSPQEPRGRYSPVARGPIARPRDVSKRATALLGGSRLTGVQMPRKSPPTRAYLRVSCARCDGLAPKSAWKHAAGRGPAPTLIGDCPLLPDAPDLHQRAQMVLFELVQCKRGSGSKSRAHNEIFENNRNYERVDRRRPLWTGRLEQGAARSPRCPLAAAERLDRSHLRVNDRGKRGGAVSVSQGKGQQTQP
jgi:hypothetical protein